MTYYLWMKQRGYGCDYTIACGEKLVCLNTDHLPTAKKAAKKELEEYGDDIEESLLLGFVDGADQIARQIQEEADQAAEQRAAEEKKQRIEELKAELAELEQD